MKLINSTPRFTGPVSLAIVLIARREIHRQCNQQQNERPQLTAHDGGEICERHLFIKGLGLATQF